LEHESGSYWLTGAEKGTQKEAIRVQQGKKRYDQASTEGAPTTITKELPKQKQGEKGSRGRHFKGFSIGGENPATKAAWNVECLQNGVTQQVRAQSEG